MATGGNLAVFSVSDDSGSTWEVVGCTYVIPDVDWGTISVNKEYCINSDTPVITTGNKEYAQSTVEFAWTEASTQAGNAILAAARDATVDEDKEVLIQVEINNSKGLNGTQYESNQIVVGYKHTGFTKDGSIKTQVILEQLSDPTETVAAAS